MASSRLSWRSSWLGTRRQGDRKSTRLNSSHSQISYAVFCLKKKKIEQPVRKTLPIASGMFYPLQPLCSAVLMEDGRSVNCVRQDMPTPAERPRLTTQWLDGL